MSDFYWGFICCKVVLFLVVCPALPAERTPGGRPGNVLVAAGQGTCHSWWSPRLQRRAHTQSLYRRYSRRFPSPERNKKHKRWRGGEKNDHHRDRWLKKERKKKQGQEGNGSRKRTDVKSFWGSFLTVCYWPAAYGFRRRRMEIHGQF